MLGPQLLAALGPAAAQLTAGRIDSADFELRTPLAPGARWDDPGNSFSGALSLRDARLAAGDSWPGAEDLAARIDWRGARLRATFAGGRSGSFRLSAGRAEWDGRGTRATHLSARLAGRAQEALDWLRAHPQLGAWTPAVQDLEVQGDTLLDLDLTLPHGAARARRARGARHARRSTARACGCSPACRRSSRCAARWCLPPATCSARTSAGSGSAAR